MENIVEIIERVKQASSDDLYFTAITSPETEQACDLLEKEKKIVLPGDYRRVLTTYGTFDFSGPETNIILLTIETMKSNTIVPVDRLGEVFVFGTDNGGSQYFYDIHNIGTRGAYCIYDVDPGTPEWKYCNYCAPNLTALLLKICVL